jgi:hypothetical protein
MRTCRPIALLGLLAVMAALAFPGEGSALSAVSIDLRPSGPSPADLTILVGMYPFWHNSDQATHSVTFANGLCSFQLAPGASGQCPTRFDVGRYPYTVDGTIEASLVVTALAPDTVTLTARTHALRHGARLRLHGTLAAYECCLPPPARGSAPVVVLARHDRHHPFRRLARAATKPSHGAGYPWSLRVRPRTTTIYIAKLTYQPTGAQGLRVAWSRPYRVRVSPSRR